MRKYRRIISLVLSIVFISMLASLCVFACFHCEVCCHGETCYICAMIHAADAVLRSCCVFACILFALEALYDIFAVRLCLFPCILRRSLVVLKVKLND